MIFLKEIIKRHQEFLKFKKNSEDYKTESLSVISDQKNYALSLDEYFWYSNLFWSIILFEDINIMEWHRANLSNSDLSSSEELCDANLERADLQKANLKGANLFRINLSHADLSGANLQNTILANANLKSAIMNDAFAQEADFRNANLEGVIGLNSEQFAGADMSNTKLDKEISEFQGLEMVKEASENARKVFVSLLIACIFSLITLAAASSGGQSADLSLPIIDLKVPMNIFYTTTPLLVVGLHIYFLLYLQRLWECLSTLPAKFPDGRPLHEKAYPWLLNSVVRYHILRLKEQEAAFKKTEYFITSFLLWWAVPITILLFFAMSLYAKLHVVSMFLLIILALSIYIGIISFKNTVNTFDFNTKKN